MGAKDVHEAAASRRRPKGAPSAENPAKIDESTAAETSEREPSDDGPEAAIQRPPADS